MGFAVTTLDRMLLIAGAGTVFALFRPVDVTGAHDGPAVLPQLRNEAAVTTPDAHKTVFLLTEGDGSPATPNIMWTLQK